MSYIPKLFDAPKITTRTLTSRTPGGGTRTVTTTNIRELQPDPSAQSSCDICPLSTASGIRPPSGMRPPSGTRPPGRTEKSRCKCGSGKEKPPSDEPKSKCKCGSGKRREPSEERPITDAPRKKGCKGKCGAGRDKPEREQEEYPASRIRPPGPSGGGSGIRPPGAIPRSAPGPQIVRTPCPSTAATSRMPPPQAGRPAGRIPSRQPPRQPQTAPPQQLRQPMAGQYNVPAPYGQRTLQGKQTVFSSPADLRGRMEANVPKELRYGSVKPCPGAGARNMGALQGTRMGDTFSGNFSVYGGPMAPEDMGGDTSELDERMNETAAAELFDMSSPEVGLAEEEAARELMERSMANHNQIVFAKSQQIHCVKKPHMIQTPAGMEPVIQQAYTERRVERDEHAETVIKTLAVTDVDENTGRGTRVTISEAQLDPDYGLSAEGRDVVEVKETVSITPSYSSSAKEVRHESITPRMQIDPKELAQLVEEENLDIDNTLSMAPPDFTFKEDRIAVKRRLQKLRLNTESMILLEESVVNPAPTADEAMVETPPEALANIMHTVESGVTPECPPDQIFHTLFEEKLTEQSVVLSSIGPGPLQDVMVPQTLTKDIHKESMTHDLTDLTNIYKNVTDAKDWPPVDIFDSVMNDEKKSPKKGIKSRKFKPVKDEEPPWGDEDLEPLVNIVGAEPEVVLDPANVPDLETSGNLETELTHGIEYFVDADPVQYMSRVQLRGSQPPPWFPGYIYCLPEFPDVVKLARNPDEVFISSWRSCQPRLIPETSMSILE